MALIYPIDIDFDVVKKNSKAEAKILREFKKLKGKQTDDWIVFYSYYFKGQEASRNISDNELRMQYNNEIDFLILAPNLGIFVFEIKGGRIRVDDGVIYSIDEKNDRHKIDPYRQSKNNYYLLKEIIEKSGFSISNFIFGNLVGFPSISEVPFVGGQSNEVDTYVSKDNLYSFIKRNAEYCKAMYPNKQAPTKKDIDEIVKILKGKNFTYSLGIADYIKSVNIKLDQLTEGQTIVFKGLLNNPRCLIQGAAGTGKTILGQFLFKYLVENEKKSVIYFTFNKLIAERVNLDMQKGSNSKCYAIIEFLKEKYYEIKKEEFDFNKDGKNYDERKMELFNEVANELFSSNVLDKYDCVIIDEAQDIVYSEEVVLFLNSIINGGIDNGSCYLFFDGNQNIFSKKELPLFKAIEFSRYRYANFQLLVNCRNSLGVQRVMDAILKMKTHSNDVYKVISTSNSEEVKCFTIKKSNDEAFEIIKETIENLLINGIQGAQITVLFNRRLDETNIVLSKLKEWFGNNISEYKVKKKNTITYSTVRSFKGLENDIIIYINDYERCNSAEHYVGVSRAKVLSYFFRIN